jgi:hypothetical protein
MISARIPVKPVCVRSVPLQVTIFGDTIMFTMLLALVSVFAGGHRDAVASSDDCCGDGSCCGSGCCGR